MLMMVPHDLPVAVDICSRIVVLSDGEITVDAPAGTALAHPSERVRHLVESMIRP